METSGDVCAFCDILEGRAEASLAFQDDHTIVAMESNPVNPGHALVIPRVHAAGLEDLDEEAGTRMWRIAQRVAVGLRHSGLRCEGITMVLGDGEPALLGVFHAHVHVFPRFRGDDFVIDADCEPRDRRLLNQEAWVLREAMKALAAPRRVPAADRTATA
ncbi:HIT family protein [Sphaerisporangium album]|uniref:HIT family protein n=1 Tax=Sphaerisporangium album TaxID=509200 RepID=A0A367FMS3_9ACTN|nr:HIT family protein [Sphaerisporangium album]RCG31686.1 HIT family protein [Sphaerisporangium album]